MKYEIRYVWVLWTLQKKRCVSCAYYYNFILISFLLKCVFLFTVKLGSHRELSSAVGWGGCCCFLFFCFMFIPTDLWRFSSTRVEEGFAWNSQIRSSSMGYIRTALAETCKGVRGRPLGQELGIREPRSPRHLWVWYFVRNSVPGQGPKAFVFLGGHTS